MCGIVGVCGKLMVKEENVFKSLLCLDTIRGPDSTGILGVSASTGFEIFKKVGTPWDCFPEKGCEKIFKYTNVMLLGHNRWATVGTVTDENAHPFDVGDIVGVHNGTIRNSYKLDDDKFFNVDSETMLHNFAKNGVTETVKKIDGAFASVFYDKRDHTIHFLRNKERPLYYTYTKDNKTLVWASEAWMLSVACGRHGLEIGEIKELPEMMEYHFKLPTVSPSQVEALPDFEKSVLIKESYSYKTNYSHWDQRPWKASDDTPKQTPLTLVTAKDTVERWYKKLVSFVGKDINFTVSGYVDGKHQKFLRAYVECPEADVIEVRIFMEEKNKKFKDLLSRDTVWKGHVKRANHLGIGKGYLLLDNRTIGLAALRDLKTVVNPKEKNFNGYKGKIMTAEEWLEATSCGCDQCSSIPTMAQAMDLNWYDDSRFFCKHCFNTQTVQQYLSVFENEAANA